MFCSCPSSGVFTAPVRGVYYFRFTAADGRRSKTKAGVQMLKNDHKIMVIHILNNGLWSYASNAVTLELEQGDMIMMRLPSGYSLFDDNNNNYNTFSGFLLFPM